MATAEAISHLLGEAGQLDDRIVAIARTGDAEWLIQVGEIDVDIEFDADSGRLLFMTEIGSPSPDRREEVLEAVLAYSFLWRETGGVRMAVERPGGHIQQLVDVNADGLLPAVAATVAVNLADNTEIWRRFFELADHAPTDQPLDFPNEFIIRG